MKVHWRQLGWGGCVSLALIAIGLALHGWVTPGTTTITIRWETANELDTVGFNLYRSETATDLSVRLNAALIPAVADPLVGNVYVYEDTTVQPNHTYYYYLEDVATDGQTARYGPETQQAPPPLAWQWAGGLALIALALLFILQLSRSTERTK